MPMLGPEWGLSGKQTKDILQCFGPNEFLGKENELSNLLRLCPKTYMLNV